MPLITREEFLKKAGLLAGFAVTAACFSSCKDESPHVYTPDTDVDFKIDVSDGQYAALKFTGGYIFVDRVVVAKIGDKEYIAASKVCSDENLEGMIYSDGEWYCTEHDATFDHQGNGTETYNNKGARGILVYQTALEGNILHVFSN